MKATHDLLKQLHIDRQSPAPESSRRGLWWALAGVGALAVLLAAYLLLGRSQPLPVHTATVTAPIAGSAAASVLDATGYVTARRIATVSSKITGKVREVLIEEGQQVAQGQVLARLDADDMNAQYELSRSQLASAQSQLAEAQAQLKLAESNLLRQRELAAKQLVAASSLDAAVADRDSLAARLSSLQRNVKVMQDQLAIAALGVDNTIIRAPFAGVIVTKAAQPGEMISPVSAGGGSIRTGIGTLVDMDSLEVQVDVGEAFIGKVKARQPVQATLNAYPDWKIPAEVIAIIPTADRSKATVKVRIALNVRDPRIVPDMGVKVAFLDQAKPDTAQSKPQGVLVPDEAIVQRDGKDVSFVLKDGHAERRAIRVGGTSGGKQQILSGLSDGETVILDPPEQLADGMPVQSNANQ